MSNANGATPSLTFNGTGIAWIGVEDPYSGEAYVYLDGVLNVVDTCASNPLFQQPLFTAYGLAPGPHRLAIEVLHVRMTKPADPGSGSMRLWRRRASRR